MRRQWNFLSYSHESYDIFAVDLDRYTAETVANLKGILKFNTVPTMFVFKNDGILHPSNISPTDRTYVNILNTINNQL